MPKGDIRVSIVKMTNMWLNDNETKDLIFKVAKTVSDEGEVMTYHKTELELNEKGSLDFDFETFYYTD